MLGATTLWAMVAAFSAGALSGFTGFGLAAVVVPLLLVAVLSLSVAAAVVRDSLRASWASSPPSDRYYNECSVESERKWRQAIRSSGSTYRSIEEVQPHEREEHGAWSYGRVHVWRSKAANGRRTRGGCVLSLPRLPGF